MTDKKCVIEGNMAMIRTITDEHILQVRNIITHILVSPIYNPYNGSMPLGKLQNILRNDNNELYLNVIGYGRKKLLLFMEDCPDIVVFLDSKKRYRIRSYNNSQYDIGDNMEERANIYANKFIIEIVKIIISRQQEMMSDINYIIAHYNDTAQEYINFAKKLNPDSELRYVSYNTRGELIRLLLDYSKNNDDIKIEKINNKYKLKMDWQ